MKRRIHIELFASFPRGGENDYVQPESYIPDKTNLTDALCHQNYKIHFFLCFFLKRVISSIRCLCGTDLQTDGHK